jgi:hypothetical protein
VQAAPQTLATREAAAPLQAAAQLDIFADSQDVQRRNACIDALLADDWPAAAAALEAWREAGAAEALIADAALLAAASSASSATTNATTVIAQQRDRQTQLRDILTPAAQRLLGGDARPWLLRRWRNLAGAAARLHAPGGARPWQAEQADVHPAALWLSAEDWHAARQAVENIASWRRVPQPLLWMAETRWREGNTDAAWPLLAEGLCLAPRLAAPLLRSLADTRLARTLERFDEQMEPAGDEAWSALPAWLLIDQPLLAPVFDAAEPPPQHTGSVALELVSMLLRLEAQGRQTEIAAARQRLRTIDARLFACYMRTR